MKKRKKMYAIALLVVILLAILFDVDVFRKRNEATGAILNPQYYNSLQRAPIDK